jgi:hypothetical protein
MSGKKDIDKEFDMVNRLADIWNDYISLPELHPMHKLDIADAIHVIQRTILCREGLRKLKEKDEQIYKLIIKK